jgi:poly(3-hydroxybutyrate) depolymerase
MTQGSPHACILLVVFAGGWTACAAASDPTPGAPAGSSGASTLQIQVPTVPQPSVSAVPVEVPSMVTPALPSSAASAPQPTIAEPAQSGADSGVLAPPSSSAPPAPLDTSPVVVPSVSGSVGTAPLPSSEPSSAGAMLPPLQPAAEAIFFGTELDAATVMAASRELAQTSVDPASAQWRTKGDQHRTYHFDGTNKDEPYRLYVPTTWDGQSQLPLVMFLHGAGSNENTYVDQNDKLMLRLAEEHGFLLVAPLGAAGAYGNFLRLSAPFGNQQGADDLMDEVTPDSLRTNELSETDVINVLERVLAEYPIDTAAMFLTGHSMGSGGTWYIGGKYSTYWSAIAPMSGPFVQETGYPWSNLDDLAIFVTEGVQTPSLEGSRLLADWLTTHGFNAKYEEVDADHAGMVPLVLPRVFAFFDESRAQ